MSDSTLRSLLPPQFKNIAKIQGRVWLRMLNIFQEYTFLVTFMLWSLFKNSRISAKNFKIEGLGENKIAYMKHIKIQ